MSATCSSRVVNALLKEVTPPGSRTYHGPPVRLDTIELLACTEPGGSACCYWNGYRT